MTGWHARALPVVAGLAISACVAADAGDRTVAGAPDRASFPDVSNLLDRRCGTLDCHGITYRNLRIYGHEGLRLDPTMRPSSTSNTTAAEFDATFDSLVSLEPEIMTAVVRDGGKNPERLTFLRKARGTEDHKGLTLWQDGDEADRCVTSWLATTIDVAACRSALAAR